jgi:hypothetical protein
MDYDASLEPCFATDVHTMKTRYYSLDLLTPDTTATTSLVMPPFDVQASASGFALGCEPVGSKTRCSALVRASTEGTQYLLAMPRWSAPCAPAEDHQPIPMALAAGKQAVFVDYFETPPLCSGVAGTFSLVAIAPGVAGADRALATAPFVLP